MPMRSTFEISTQIILLKIEGFLKGWILNITPLKAANYIHEFLDENYQCLPQCSGRMTP